MIAKRKPATRDQQAYQDAARELGCVVCRLRKCDMAGYSEIHHRNLDDKHGQRQLGQDAVVAMCSWHHRGIPLLGWGDDEMRDAFGPSFASHARDFRAWTEDVLPHLTGRGTERWQKYQDELLGDSWK